VSGPRQGGDHVDFEPIEDRSIRRVAVADVIGDLGNRAQRPIGRESGRLLGTLVHRLVRRFGIEAGADADAEAIRLLKPEEAVDVLDPAALGREAAAAYRALCAIPDLGELYRSGQPLHEVPFTMAAEGRIVRGTIDCLVQNQAGITVLEFKTGRNRPEHQRQVELYAQAVRAMHPGTAVHARLIYLEEALI
jgi:ATP-dependent helicase/nuclease subunit A